MPSEFWTCISSGEDGNGFGVRLCGMGGVVDVGGHRQRMGMSSDEWMEWRWSGSFDSIGNGKQVLRLSPSYKEFDLKLH
jgi:hypothetical protein